MFDPFSRFEVYWIQQTIKQTPRHPSKVYINYLQDKSVFQEQQRINFWFSMHHPG